MKLSDRIGQWVDDDRAFAEIIDQLHQAKSIALDTEFHRERTYFPQLALLQLAWDPEHLVLVDPLAVDLAPLASVFESETTIVLHAASQDLEVLRLATGTVPRQMFDTQVAAGFNGFATPSLAVLHDRLLGIELGKADRLTDWLIRPLDDRALSYAADDVRHLLRIRDRLVADLTNQGRLDWALAECEEQRLKSLSLRDPQLAWLRCKEARSLTGRAASVARSVGAWREARAAELDIPVRYVLGDLAMVSIAQRPPASLPALRKVRGIEGRGLSDAVAETLLEAVARGVEDERPVVRKRREASIERDLRPAVTLISSWISQYAKELGIDTALLATRHDIEEAVAGSGEGRLADGWRRDLVGEPLQRLLAGEAALAFDRARGIVLEPRGDVAKDQDRKTSA